MFAERIDRDSTYLGILTANVVSGYESLRFITHCLFDCTLASNSSTTSSFGATTRCFSIAAISCFDSAQFRGTLALAQRTSESALQRFKSCRLFTSHELTLTPTVTCSHLSTASATTTAISG
jgi:hypothetical protein